MTRVINASLLDKKLVGVANTEHLNDSMAGLAVQYRQNVQMLPGKAYAAGRQVIKSLDVHYGPVAHGA